MPQLAALSGSIIKGTGLNSPDYISNRVFLALHAPDTEGNRG